MFLLIQKCVQKIKQDQSEVLLITPVWKFRTWYPPLLEMLTDRRSLLPLHSLLLYPPMFPSQVHPLMKKNIGPAIWPVSGNPLVGGIHFRWARMCSGVVGVAISGWAWGLQGEHGTNIFIALMYFPFFLFLIYCIVILFSSPMLYIYFEK